MLVSRAGGSSRENHVRCSAEDRRLHLATDDEHRHVQDLTRIHRDAESREDGHRRRRVRPEDGQARHTDAGRGDARSRALHVERRRRSSIYVQHGHARRRERVLRRPEIRRAAAAQLQGVQGARAELRERGPVGPLRARRQLRRRFRRGLLSREGRLARCADGVHRAFGIERACAAEQAVRTLVPHGSLEPVRSRRGSRHRPDRRVPFRLEDRKALA
jgi:hypothetical protein